MARKATYIAMTTHNYQTNGYNIILAAGHNKSAVEDKARELIGAVQRPSEAFTDIYKDTEHKNLVVVSKTAAKRMGFNWDTYYPDPYDTERCVWVE
jgi:hypothetical protein